MNEEELKRILDLLAAHKEATRDIAEALVGSPLIDPENSVAGGLREVASAIRELAEAVRETTQ